MAIPPRHHNPSDLPATLLQALYRAWQTGTVLTAAQAATATRVAHPDLDPGQAADALDALTRAGIARRAGHGWSLRTSYWTTREARTTTP